MVNICDDLDTDDRLLSQKQRLLIQLEHHSDNVKRQIVRIWLMFSLFIVLSVGTFITLTYTAGTPAGNWGNIVAAVMWIYIFSYQLPFVWHEYLVTNYGYRARTGQLIASLDAALESILSDTGENP